MKSLSKHISENLSESMTDNHGEFPLFVEFHDERFKKTSASENSCVYTNVKRFPGANIAAIQSLAKRRFKLDNIQVLRQNGDKVIIKIEKSS